MLLCQKALLWISISDLRWLRPIMNATTKLCPSDLSIFITKIWRIKSNIPRFRKKSTEEEGRQPQKTLRSKYRYLLNCSSAKKAAGAYCISKVFRLLVGGEKQLTGVGYTWDLVQIGSWDLRRENRDQVPQGLPQSQGLAFARGSESCHIWVRRFTSGVSSPSLHPSAGWMQRTSKPYRWAIKWKESESSSHHTDGYLLTRKTYVRVYRSVG